MDKISRPNQRTNFLIILGPALALVTTLLLSANLPLAAAFTAGVTIWCVLWWITEPVPIPVTSMLPLSLFPFGGVLTPTEVAQAYGSPVILLLLSGFILSKALEATGTHKRLALAMINLSVRITGTNNDRSLVLGFMLAAAVLSMWISNTATTLMLLPIALAVLDQRDDKNLAMVLMLSIAYAANIGGIGTPIGTPPNLIFMQVYQESTGQSFGFLDWMKIGVPVVIVLIPVAMWWITRKLTSSANVTLPEVGQWQVAEKRVLMVFVLVAVLWITRTEPLGGWSGLFGLNHVNDAAVGLLAVVLMFITPDGKGKRLLNWEYANTIPWGILLLFAGGICIAKAFVASGLSTELASLFGVLTGFPIYIMLLFICLGVSFLTETTSNTATTTLLMPVLAAVASGAQMPVELLMIPAAISASCAFMLPVATAPNAVIFSSGKVPSVVMLRLGLMLNILAAFIIAGISYWLL